MSETRPLLLRGFSVEEKQQEELGKPVHGCLEYEPSLRLCFPSLCKRPWEETDRCWQHLGHCCRASKQLWAAAGEKELLC